MKKMKMWVWVMLVSLACIGFEAQAAEANIVGKFGAEAEYQITDWVKVGAIAAKNVPIDARADINDDGIVDLFDWVGSGNLAVKNLDRPPGRDLRIISPSSRRPAEGPFIKGSSYPIEWVRKREVATAVISLSQGDNKVFEGTMSLVTPFLLSVPNGVPSGTYTIRITGGISGGTTVQDETTVTVQERFRTEVTGVSVSPSSPQEAVAGTETVVGEYTLDMNLNQYLYVVQVRAVLKRPNSAPVHGTYLLSGFAVRDPSGSVTGGGLWVPPGVEEIPPPREKEYSGTLAFAPKSSVLLNQTLTISVRAQIPSTEAGATLSTTVESLAILPLSGNLLEIYGVTVSGVTSTVNLIAPPVAPANQKQVQDLKRFLQR